MAEFIDASIVKNNFNEIDHEKIDNFINAFNKLIVTNKKKKFYFLINSISSTLTDIEFNAIKEKAASAGYDIIRYNDNYNSITYKLIIK